MDDLYPNEGTYFQPDVPAQTKQDNEDELARSAQALPVIEGIMDWFDAAIEGTDSRKALHEEAKNRNKSLEIIDEAYDIVRELLELKRDEFRNLKLNIKK